VCFVKTSLMFRSLASCLKVEVCSGVSTGTNNAAPGRERRRGLEDRAAGTWTRAARLFLGALWLGVVLVGGVVLCPLHAQPVVKTWTEYKHPYRVVVDGSGNIYIDLFEWGEDVIELSGCASGSCVTTDLNVGMNNPMGLAVDGNGNVYVSGYLADGGTITNIVEELPAGCASTACATTLGGGFSRPYGVAVDGSGNIYVADNENNAVKGMPPGCTSAACVTTLGRRLQRT
jgi:hypothetical protein